MRTPTLFIMAKRPEAGRVKTRLARDVGSIEALRLYRELLRATCRKLSRDPRWRGVLAQTPDRKGARLKLPSGIVRIGQGRGDLGQRMQRLFDRQRNRRACEPRLVIGADIPGVVPGQIAEGFRLLAGHDAVFGPAEDGGFWLVGLSRRRARLAPFAQVRWSSAHALADTIDHLAGRRIALAATLCDLDTGADLMRLKGAVSPSVAPTAP